jgi:hypothetical protein
VDCRWFDVHGIPESTEQCTSLFDTRDNGTWFSVVVYDHERRWCSNKSYNPKQVQAGQRDNGSTEDCPVTVLGIGSGNFEISKIKKNRSFLRRHPPVALKLIAATLPISLESSVVQS